MMNLVLSEAQFPLRFRPESPMSDDDLMRFCSSNDSLRVEREPNGEILIMTPAGSKTSKMNIRITRLLDEWAEADGHGVAFDSSGGFTLADGSMRNPDAAWVAIARWNALSDAEQSVFAPLCPDFVIELRSPTDRLIDAQNKMEHWIASGVMVAWLIDPASRNVHVYRSQETPEIHEDPSSVQGTGAVRGFELVMSRVWG